MPSTKGKEKVVTIDGPAGEELDIHPHPDAASGSNFGSDSDSDSASDSNSESDSSSSESDSESDLDEETTKKFLATLLERARKNAAARLLSRDAPKHLAADDEEDVIVLDSDEPQKDKPLPPLDPGTLPSPYIELGSSRKSGPSAVRDIDTELVQQANPSLDTPAPPSVPPELTNTGKRLTKKERKALKNTTAGPDWFDLPAPAEAELPRLYREVEALRLRNQLDPKRFYRKDEGEGKGIKGLPKHFAIGTIVPTSTPFGTDSGDNLSRSSRKRTLVDELVDDAEAKSYAKKKFKDLQSVRGARGRGTLAQRKAARRLKW
ncbi:uncharacterized protein FIBRA_05161 [Fibroporia radiculosa]|uniref:Fcf2 pre-rRNA processing C-terminal domain-containing protein n=1 Tax=Fibroporia radiculosa TaxID=599839 RepID=J4G8P4_9APHY|nr:uncharacterized protein FIBRA_05161 [Fibroporia radiculosa]CCM03043.1 predicted protein [Fibroporia radiculosa]